MTEFVPLVHVSISKFCIFFSFHLFHFSVLVLNFISFFFFYVLIPMYFGYRKYDLDTAGVVVSLVWAGDRG